MIHPHITRSLLILLFSLLFFSLSGLFGLSIPAPFVSAHSITTHSPRSLRSLHSSRPSQVNDGLFGATCVIASNCWAVGSHTSGQSRPKVLIEHWDGSAWTFVPGATPQGTQTVSLSSVSCPDATTCMAVGNYLKLGDFVNLSEIWHGSSWSLIPTPNAPDSRTDNLEGVSCTSATNCIAVGDAYSFSQQRVEAIANRWDGTRWSRMSIQNPGTDGNQLFAISCPDTAFCMATGTTSNRAGTQFTLTERWDGTAWSVVASPNPPRTVLDALFGISCFSASACVSVGEYTTSNTQPFLTLAIGWNGTRWSLQTTPNRSGSSDDDLGGVSCTSATTCMATGTAAITGVVTLAEIWKGSTWSIVPSPNAPGSLSALASVACATASKCVAVGDNFNNNSSLAFAESWNGTRWFIEPVPVP